ncbi:MAG: flavodoxin family protein [Gordonibacter sp.]
MTKKVLILNGSPRRNGNTAMLVEQFVKGVQDAGNEAERFDVALMDIASCRGCLGGGADPASPCVQKDDMDAVYAAYLKADVIALASPVYCWSITAQLKAALDRLFALMEAGMKAGAAAPAPQPKSSVLIMPAEDASYRNFAPVVTYYEALAARMGWLDAGRVLVGGMYLAGDIAGSPALDEAYQLGASL